MGPAFVVDLVLAAPVVVGMAWAAGRALSQRRSPAVPIAVAGVAATTVNWGSADWFAWGQGPDVPDWVDAVTALSWGIVLLTYPDGRVRPRWAWAVLAALLAGSVAIGSPQFDGVGAALLMGAFLTSAGVQVWRFTRRDSIEERQAVRWLLLGLIPFLATCVGVPALAALPTTADGLGTDGPLGAAAVIATWAVSYCAAIGILAPSRLAPDRALPAVTGICLGGLLAGSVFGLAAMAMPGEWAAAIALLAAWPLVHAARALGLRLVYGRAGAPALAAVSRRLESSLAADDVAGIVAESVARELDLPYACVDVDGVRVAAGTPRARVESFAISYQGEPVARLEVSPREAEAVLLPRDRLLLERLAASAAPALHGARTVFRLRAAQEGLRRAREEERMRLRRDLHDELAPTLAGLGLTAAVLAGGARDESARSDANRLAEGLRAAAEQVRELAHGLRPSLLDEHGFVAALRQRLVVAGSRPDVIVESDWSDEELPESWKLALLRVAQEAVSNARRHADATTCRVSLVRDDGDLVLEVEDDGAGFAPGATPGMGLDSIRRRVEELGGSVAIRSDSSGTRVTAILPMTARVLEAIP